ncbi:hypothetical protein CEE45_01845 [Candidatus Heimdallarchaeota archaeon B3_Heim]|nr:MAG: hypothetical protein CEE45_01845 [Candidatus Heimdallarchaeota archaeon B3_Heim]
MTKRSAISGVFLFCILTLIGTFCLSISDFPLGDFDQFIPNPRYKASQWTSHSPIFVHGITNFTQTANAESWSGDGTRANPYIIEGYNISNSGSLIVIQDSPLYFKIRDCFLNETSRVGRGIVISGSSNGIIEDNMLFGSYYGIELYNSDYTTIQGNQITNSSIGIILNSSDSNDITHNGLANNLDYGISILDGSNLNTIAWNSFFYNGGISSEAFDAGVNNIFVFNHWGALTSPDNNADEIVDVPYMLDGTANNRDAYPLISNYPDIHEMLEPKVLFPNGGVVNTSGIISIQWLKAVDYMGHPISYSLEYSEDGGSNWIQIIAGLSLNYFEWDVSNTSTDLTYIIRLTATCSETLSKSDLSDNSFSINVDPSFTNTVTSTQTNTVSQPSETTSSSFGTNLSDFIPPTLIISLFLLGLIVVYRYRKTSSLEPKLVSLRDLKRNRAVPIKTLTEDLECSRLDLPRKIKHEIGDKKYSLVLRSDMIVLEDNPPSDSMCQLCAGKLEGLAYFQCKSCMRYVCAPHYVDLKKIDEEKCPNCNDQLSIFPFTCEGCKLDYNQTIDLKDNSEKCKLCGFSLPSQNQLIADNTRNISSTMDRDIMKDEFEDKDKISTKYDS